MAWALKRKGRPGNLVSTRCEPLQETIVLAQGLSRLASRRNALRLRLTPLVQRRARACSYSMPCGCGMLNSQVWPTRARGW